MKHNGFTLLEVLIVIAMIGILSAVAIPSYQRHVTKTYRVDAQQSLLGLAMEIERYSIKNGAYAYWIKDDGLVSFDTEDAVLVTLDIIALQKKYAVKFYDIAIQNTAHEFQLTAIPKEGQKGDGKLFVNQCGFQGWDKNNNAVEPPHWYHNCSNPETHYEVNWP